MFYFAFSFLLLSFARENAAQCNYYQLMQQNQEYFIYNNEYPDYYSSESHCYWKAEVAQYSQFVVDCTVEMYSRDTIVIRSPNEADFTINASGAYSRIFYGYQLQFYFDTTTNRLGGRFQCRLVAQQATEPPVTPLPCDCGWRHEQKIVGGVPANVNEFPFMAAIVDTNTGNRIICGGTIISEYHIMTAAHCLASFNVSNLVILVGEHDITTGADTSATKVYFIQDYIIHDQYNSNTFENDIALILTRTAIVFSMRVGPACLPYTLWVNDGSYDVTVMGWGTTEFSGPSSDTLLKVNLNTITQASCTSKNRNVKPSMMCTLTPGKDACQFDSGGPAVYFDPTRQRYKCVGITSFGTGCGDLNPGVYTRVQNFIPWIEFNTGYTFCRK